MDCNGHVEQLRYGTPARPRLLQLVPSAMAPVASDAELAEAFLEEAATAPGADVDHRRVDRAQDLHRSRSEAVMGRIRARGTLLRRVSRRLQDDLHRRTS